MLKETGRITDIKIINGKKTVVVECISKSACKSCGNNDNCGVGVVAKGLSNKSHQLSMPYKEGMAIDASIELLIENKDIVKSSIIVYVIPLLFFVLGTVFSYYFFNNEPLIILISILSLLTGVLIAKAASAKLYPINSLSRLISTK